MSASPIGLSTYAFFWQWSGRAAHPLTLADMIASTADQGAQVFQICDYPMVADLSDDELDAIRKQSVASGVRLELGTRGLQPDHLQRYLAIARLLDVRLVRSMFNTADHRPTPEEATSLLAQSLPAYEAAGVTLALETYEQVPTATLVDVVASFGSANLGICLDPGNCIAALETPATVIDLVAPYVKNLHVKDFHFTRQDGWVGFSLIGTPMGTGQLDYPLLMERSRAAEQGLSRIIEHWLPWQGDAATTIETEQRWTAHNLEYLRSN